MRVVDGKPERSPAILKAILRFLREMDKCHMPVGDICGLVHYVLGQRLAHTIGAFVRFDRNALIWRRAFPIHEPTHLPPYAISEMQRSQAISLYDIHLLKERPCVVLLRGLRSASFPRCNYKSWQMSCHPPLHFTSCNEHTSMHRMKSEPPFC